MIKKFENGQTPTLFSRKFDLAAAAVKTILNNLEGMKDHVRGSAPLKSTINTKEVKVLCLKWRNYEYCG
jgi:hypothetical protein